MKKSSPTTNNQSKHRPFTESVFKGDDIFAKNVQNIRMSFEAVMHLSEGLCLTALLTQKVEKSIFPL
jgi:hypothetical protein